MALEFAPGKTRIGWIGTGVMGSSMCGHLIAAGYPATVFNRTAEKARPLVEKGAKLADSPRAVAEASDVIFTIVGYPQDVREVTLGEDGTLAGARPGSVLVDMTTSEPALAVEIDPGRAGQEAPLGRRAGLRRRHRRARSPAVDHDRRRERRSSTPSSRSSRSWARRSSTRDPPAPGSIPRW